MSSLYYDIQWQHEATETSVEVNDRRLASKDSYDIPEV